MPSRSEMVKSSEMVRRSRPRRCRHELSDKGLFDAARKRERAMGVYACRPDGCRSSARLMNSLIWAWLTARASAPTRTCFSQAMVQVRAS